MKYCWPTPVRPRLAGPLLSVVCPGACGAAATPALAAASAGVLYRRVTQRSTTNVSTGIVPASSTRTVCGLASFITSSRAIQYAVPR